MVTRDDVLTVLAPLVYYENGLAYLRTTEHHVIDVDTFVTRFASADVTLSSLLAHPATEETWSSRFREWHQRGILPQ